VQLGEHHDSFIGGEWVAPAVGGEYRQTTPVTGLDNRDQKPLGCSAGDETRHV
jgi:hypothetical protein